MQNSRKLIDDEVAGSELPQVFGWRLNGAFLDEYVRGSLDSKKGYKSRSALRLPPSHNERESLSLWTRSDLFIRSAARSVLRYGSGTSRAHRTTGIQLRCLAALKKKHLMAMKLHLTLV